MSEEPKVHSGAPPGAAIVRTQEETRSSALTISGRRKDRMLYSCLSCGQEKTIQFDDAELEAMGYDFTNYNGPCWNPECGYMSLWPKEELFGEDLPSIADLAKKNRRSEYKEQAEVLVETIVEKVGDVMIGQGRAQPPDAASQSVDRPADAGKNSSPDDIDISDLKPR